MTDNTADEAILNALIARTIDTAATYRDAAAEAPPGGRRSHFQRRAAERDAIVVRLQSVVRAMGATPHDHGTVMGSVVRTWRFFRIATAAAHDALVLSLAAEDVDLRDRFRDALGTDMDPRTRQAISEANVVLASTDGTPIARAA